MTTDVAGTKTDRGIRRLAATLMLAAVGVPALTFAALVIVDRSRSQALRPPPSYAVGDQVDVPADWYKQGPSTLLVFATSSCGVCQRSRPILGQIVKALRGGPTATMMVAGAERPEAEDEFARAIGLAGAKRVAVGTLKLRVVPTIVLVDQQGTVVFAHEGEPDAQVALEVVRAAETKLTAGNKHGFGG